MDNEFKDNAKETRYKTTDLYDDLVLKARKTHNRTEQKRKSIYKNVNNIRRRYKIKKFQIQRFHRI
jgi:hypothetical protein